MKGENKIDRGKLKGYMFEVIIRRLLFLNDFEITNTEIENRVKVINPNNIEIKGRGTWHQIDSPCIYKKPIPFTYDLRLLAEVKFHQNQITKEKIREYIGIIKDISENYFIDDTYSIENQKRYTDVGAFFAANGFQLEAEKLAFAHGIKTISYKSNERIDRIKQLILKLESDYLSAEYCISAGNQNKFMESFSSIIENPENSGWGIFSEDFRVEYEALEYMELLSQALNEIKSSFFGVTETNYFLHFISTSEFPAHLFESTDERECKVYYTGNDHFYMTINEDLNNDPARFYFTAPTPLLESIFNPIRVLHEKEQHFNKIKVPISLGGIQRSLVLRIDSRWLDNLIRRERKKNMYYNSHLD